MKIKSIKDGKKKATLKKAASKKPVTRRGSKKKGASEYYDMDEMSDNFIPDDDDADEPNDNID